MAKLVMSHHKDGAHNNQNKAVVFEGQARSSLPVTILQQLLAYAIWSEPVSASPLARTSSIKYLQPSWYCPSFA
jgi:hypothetical protein